VRIYNGDELYDTGMSKNSEQKGLAALEDAVAYTEKQTRTKRQDVAEGSSYRTDSMVSHISQIIRDIYPQGGDKNSYMKLVAREMPSIVKANPKLFRRAFGIAYDRFFHIGQDDDNDDNFDYTDYSMRQGERGMAEGRYGRYYDPMDDERRQQDAMDQERRDFKRKEMEWELRNEPPNNIQVVINGKPWKVFAGRGRPDSAEEFNHLRKMQAWAASKSSATGKKWSVHLTGAPASK
jgi:hypothetical protein